MVGMVTVLEVLATGERGLGVRMLGWEAAVVQVLMGVWEAVGAV